jgi:hypothetical protein
LKWLQGRAKNFPISFEWFLWHVWMRKMIKAADDWQSCINGKIELLFSVLTFFKKSIGVDNEN